MRVVIVSGIWPPDVGGPASHAPALADALLAEGHEVEIVTTAGAQPDPRPYRLAVERTGAEAGEVALVAAHWWDVTGAKAAGLRTGCARPTGAASSSRMSATDRAVAWPGS